MLGQRAGAEISPCNLKEAGGSSEATASSHIPAQSVAWVWLGHYQFLNILLFPTRQQSPRFVMSGDTTVAQRFKTHKLPVFIV